MRGLQGAHARCRWQRRLRLITLYRPRTCCKACSPSFAPFWKLRAMDSTVPVSSVGGGSSTSRALSSSSPVPTEISNSEVSVRGSGLVSRGGVAQSSVWKELIERSASIAWVVPRR
eukprot:COSAG01_NODE_30_length_36127_cov_41.433234_24_plen_116_part_00